MRGTVWGAHHQDFTEMSTTYSSRVQKERVKFATCTLMGTALTWWNSHARTVTNDVAYAMTWSDLKKKMTTKYCPRNEIKKIEAELLFPCKRLTKLKYVGGMPDLIYSSVVASKPKTMQEAIKMATELMDRRINTLAERQTKNKRKFEDAPRNNQNQTTKQKGQNQAGLYGLAWERVTLKTCWGSRHSRNNCPRGRKEQESGENGNGCKLGFCYAVGVLQGKTQTTTFVDGQGDGDKSKKKQLQDVPIVKNFPEVFPEDLPGLPTYSKWEISHRSMSGACTS
ncbi:putative reverse transcriptase domain-containing protein [Tanacetum coccineum]